jgi:hypothetical protein
VDRRCFSLSGAGLGPNKLAMDDMDDGRYLAVPTCYYILTLSIHSKKQNEVKGEGVDFLVFLVNKTGLPLKYSLV